MPRTPSSASAQLAVSRDSLAHRVLSILEAQLREGRWGEMLPGERKLSETLQVSRMTLRQALSELERRGWLTSGRGKRRRILGPPSQRSKPKRFIILLAPVPLQSMEPQMMLLIHHLAESLLKRGLHLEIEARPSCFTRHPEKALAALTSEHRPSGWILFRGNQPCQEWFHRSNLPFVIMGSVFVRDSPTFGSEHAAIGAHAAAQFWRLGHRHSVIIAPRQQTKAFSDEALIQGFERAGLSCQVLLHDRSRKGILQSMESALALRPGVTAIFIIGGQYSVTLLSALLNHGISVPEEISLIVMGDDPAFQYLVPSPTRYTFSPEKAAKLLFRLICRVALEGDRSRSHIGLLPDLEGGETLAPCKRPPPTRRGPPGCTKARRNL